MESRRSPNVDDPIGRVGLVVMRSNDGIVAGLVVPQRARRGRVGDDAVRDCAARPLAEDIQIPTGYQWSNS